MVSLFLLYLCWRVRLCAERKGEQREQKKELAFHGRSYLAVSKIFASSIKGIFGIFNDYPLAPFTQVEHS